jgi:pyrroline-5-carboxylate reductase
LNQPTLPSIAFIGTGNMGEAMLRGVRGSGSTLHATDLDQERLQKLAKELAFAAQPNAEAAAAAAQVVVLCTKPQSFGELLPNLAKVVQPSQLVISIAAGKTLAGLEAAFAPGTPVIRVMPNTPGLIGEGASAYCLGKNATEAHAAIAEALLKSLGLVLRVEEAQMDAVTALSGSGPAYVFLFMEALQAGGIKLGLSEEASFQLAAETLRGAAGMVLRKDSPPAQLREKVTSPGGTTAAALKVFEEAGFRDLVAKAMTAARDRSVELGR